jgi:hypothetical protein
VRVHRRTFGDSGETIDVGVDLHKQIITVAVMDAARKLLVRRPFSNRQTAEIVAFLSATGEFEITVEATASYEWFVRHSPARPPSFIVSPSVRR